MKRILFILVGIIGTVIFSSFTKMDKSGNQRKYETEIIAQTLPKLLIPIQPPPPPPFIGSEKGRKKFNYRIEKVKMDFKNRVDTTLFTVHLLNKLVIPDKSELSHLQDTMYIGLAGRLRADSLNSKSICIAQVDSLCQLKLSPKKPNEYREMGFNYLGSAIYSRIVFDDSFTHALFYFVRYRDEEDSSGHIIFVEIQNGKWIIKRDDMIWIS